MYRDTRQAELDQLHFNIVEREFKCGYCKTHVIKRQNQIFDNGEPLRWTRCSNPNCGRLNVLLDDLQIHPSSVVVEVSKDVPTKYADRYQKAVEINPIFPEASATVSRKCLEMILEDYFHAKKRNLIDKIDEVRNQLPSDLYDNLHRLREIGNFGAHPKKNSNTSELIEVEQGEADYCLWLLNELFEECYIKPARKKEINTRLDKKIEAGKRIS